MRGDVKREFLEVEVRREGTFLTLSKEKIGGKKVE